VGMCSPLKDVVHDECNQYRYQQDGGYRCCQCLLVGDNNKTRGILCLRNNYAPDAPDSSTWKCRPSVLSPIALGIDYALAVLWIK